MTRKLLLPLFFSLFLLSACGNEEKVKVKLGKVETVSTLGEDEFLQVNYTIKNEDTLAYQTTFQTEVIFDNGKIGGEKVTEKVDAGETLKDYVEIRTQGASVDEVNLKNVTHKALDY